MDKRIRINIQVGDARYPLYVDPKEEPVFREAGRMVNRRIVAYSTRFRNAALAPDEVLAMSALDLAVTCQKAGQQAADSAAVAELAAVVADLQGFLDAAPRQ